MKFKVGDRVKVARSHGPVLSGMTGTIQRIHGDGKNQYANVKLDVVLFGMIYDLGFNTKDLKLLKVKKEK